jgi:iron(III) transport system permease protein
LRVPALIAALIVVVPLVYLAVRSTEQGSGVIVDELTRPQTRAMLWRSGILAMSVTVACTAIGVGAAWLVTMTNLRGRGVWQAIFALPLAVPTYVAAYTWLGSFRSLSPFVGSFTVLTLCSYPYVYLPVLAALRRFDPQQAELARSLGCSARQVARRVLLPQIRPAVTSGALLVLLYVLSDFGAVNMMRYDTLTNGIYLSYVGSFDRTPAAILGLMLVAVTAIVVIGEMRSRGAMNTSIASARGARRRSAPIQLGWKQAPALGASGLLIGLALGVPLGALLRWTVGSDRSPIDWSLLWETVWATVMVSILGSIACTVLAVPIAYLSARVRSRTSAALEAVSYLGHALPGIVIALSMVFLGVRFLPSIYQRTPLLILAYVALFLPLAPFGVLRRVTIRIASPGVAAGAAMVALTCVKELPATLLLRPTSLDTLATRVWTETGVADYTRAAPYAIAMLLLGAVPMSVLTRVNRNAA